jgi:hypothetical protein
MPTSDGNEGRMKKQQTRLQPIDKAATETNIAFSLNAPRESKAAW